MEARCSWAAIGRALSTTTPLAPGKPLISRCNSWPAEALEHAVQLLEPRRQLMDELVTTLIEMESLSGDEFRERVERFEAAQIKPAVVAG